MPRLPLRRGLSRPPTHAYVDGVQLRAPWHRAGAASREGREGWNVGAGANCGARARGVCRTRNCPLFRFGCGARNSQCAPAMAPASAQRTRGVVLSGSGHTGRVTGARVPRAPRCSSRRISRPFLRFSFHMHIFPIPFPAPSTVRSTSSSRQDTGVRRPRYRYRHRYRHRYRYRYRCRCRY